MMDRRRFLGNLMAGLAGLTFAPKEWLWVPTCADQQAATWQFGRYEGGNDALREL